ncbi:MAG TPA: copper chaperone PCu(A)C [Sphingomicrobium sp.]|jgi:copper(I)-binding protein|nr:copper chaperone PCu(A)C [Sphingomicrobium sp.]
MKHALFFAALLLASCKPASGPPAVSVDGAWARATVPGQMGSAAYFTIRNAGGADKLLSVTSPAADASLHSTSMDNGVMRMRPLEGLDVPKDGTVELKPGGTHVMLMGLKQPLQSGATLELDLKFEKSGERKVTAEVRPASAGAGM